MLQTPLPALDDREGDHLPESLPNVIDAHVHLFPDNLFVSIWQWFDKFGWPIRYRFTSQEAIELRRAGISIPIVILGAVVHGELGDVVADDIAVTVHSSERVRLLAREARRARRRVAVHLKVDTGMARLGCAPGRALEIARLIEASDYLSLDGLCTHFSSAAEPVAVDGGATSPPSGRWLFPRRR